MQNLIQLDLVLCLVVETGQLLSLQVNLLDLVVQVFDLVSHLGQSNFWIRILFLKAVDPKIECVRLREV